jgi:sporulation-control protein spo0M
MSIVAKLGAAIGVGNLTLSVSCSDEGYQGERLRGVVTLKGGDVPRMVEGLHVRLLHVWESRDSEVSLQRDRSSVLLDQPVELRCEVLPGSTHTVPFELEIPSNVALPEQGERYAIEAHVQIPNGVDASSRERFVLWPVRPVTDVLRGLMAATGWLLEGFTPRQARAGFTRAVLLPGSAHAARFDRMNLELAADQGLLQVHATLDLNEGIWKSVTGGDEHDYSFSAPDAPSVVEKLQALIQKHAGPS